MYRTAIFGALFPVSTLSAAFLWEEHPILAALFLLIGFAGIVATVGHLCPRCRLHVDSKNGGLYFPGYAPAPDCPRCGRPRKGTWPFQWLFRPDR